MKKAFPVFLYSLLVLNLLLPAGTIIAYGFGYSFELINVPAFATLIAILSVAAAISGVSAKEFAGVKSVRILTAILSPLSLVNAAFLIVNCSTMSIVCLCITSTVCCFILAAKCVNSPTLTAISLTLSSVFAVIVAFIAFTALLFGNFGQDTVVQTLESPSKKYYAEVISSDQGALGGDTFVDVYERSGFNAIIFKTAKKPRRVYSGPWGAFETIKLNWAYDGCLVVN